MTLATTAKVSHRRRAPQAVKQPARRLHRRKATPSGRTPLKYVYHPSFSLPQTEQTLWGDDRQAIEVAPFQMALEVAEDTMHARPARPALDAADEKTLFLRYNYAKYRLEKLLELREQKAAGWSAAQQDLWQQRTSDVRDAIVHANLPLVPAMAKKVWAANVEPGDLISEGNMALLRSIEEFDVGRGYKFSTYACRAILRSFHRLAQRVQRNVKRCPVEFDPQLERSDFAERRHQEQRESAIETVRNVIRRNHADLDKTEYLVVLSRFPVVCQHKRRTLSEVSQRIGLSKERVRQIEQRALLKVRTAVEAHMLA